jgi:hypothetical protein
MITNEQVTAALRKLGEASPPLAIANALGADPQKTGYRLRAMLGEKALIAFGSGRGRTYALPDSERPSTPPQSDRAPTKRKKRHAKKPHRAPRAARPTERFIPTVDAELQLHIINGAAPVSYNEAQTAAIATLLLAHYKA